MEKYIKNLELNFILDDKQMKEVLESEILTEPLRETQQYIEEFDLLGFIHSKEKKIEMMRNSLLTELDLLYKKVSKSTVKKIQLTDSAKDKIANNFAILALASGERRLNARGMENIVKFVDSISMEKLRNEMFNFLTTERYTTKNLNKDLNGFDSLLRDTSKFTFFSGSRRVENKGKKSLLKYVTLRSSTDIQIRQVVKFDGKSISTLYGILNSDGSGMKSFIAHGTLKAREVEKLSKSVESLEGTDILKLITSVEKLAQKQVPRDKIKNIANKALSVINDDSTDAQLRKSVAKRVYPNYVSGVIKMEESKNKFIDYMISYIKSNLNEYRKVYTDESENGEHFIDTLIDAGFIFTESEMEIFEELTGVENV